MSNQNPLVSIIVPVFKVEKYLSTCLDSVLAQTYADWEMILVDDGSPDNSGKICDDYAYRERRMIVLHKENGGQSSARNLALDYPPNGDFITFLDSDDFWHPDYLRQMVELQREFNADIVQCDFLRGTEKAFPAICNKPMVEVVDNHEVFLNEMANVILCGKMYKSRLFDGVRMPVGLYNEDDWTAWKLYYNSRIIVLTSQPLYYYTVNPTSTMARLRQKPDLSYVNAYNERICFFIQTGEKDLEHCSRLQLCKSLLLTYRHKMLDYQERQFIKSKFDESWSELKHSSYIRAFYKVLFAAFHYMPKLMSYLTALMK